MTRPLGTRNLQFEDRRQALLRKAGMRLALQNGDAPSFRELALACGVSVATLRHYFGNRETLIKELFALHLEVGRRHLQNAERQPNEHESIEASLRDVLERISRGWTTGFLGSLHRIGLSEGLRHPQTALDYLVDVLEPTLQALEKRLQASIEHGLIIECDTRHAALALVSPLLLALLHQHDLGGTRCRPLSVPALIDQQVRMFSRAYRNDVAGG
jgi:AcrR family transcriptional regulator